MSSTFISHKTFQAKSYFEFLPFLFYRYQRLFVGSLVFRGRKIWAYNFLLKLKYELKKKENMEFHLIFLFSFLKITPNILLSHLKIGGAKQGVPLSISWKKKITFAIKWVRMGLVSKYKTVKLKNMVEELSSTIYNKGIGLKAKRRAYIEGFSNRFLLKRFKYRG